MKKVTNILVVIWEDSHESVGWHYTTEANYTDPKNIISVGIEIHNDADVLVISPHWTDDGKQLCAVMTIPKSAIRKTKIIDTLENYDVLK